MALLDLATVSLPLDSSFSVKISDHKIVQDGNYVLYTLNIWIEPYTWTVQRRYSDFAQLDKLRFTDKKKSFLPKKKTIGNLDPEFIADRKIELEKYLKSVIELEIWYQRQKNVHSLPLLIAQFIDMHQYEIHSIVDDLSLRLGKVGEGWIDGSRKCPKYFEFTPIEMHAIGERMRLAEPTLQGRADLSHLIEFIHSLHSLRIRGGKGFVGTSSIVSNTLSIDVSYCKNLLALWLIDCDCARLTGQLQLRDHLRKLVMHYSMEWCRDVLGEREEGEWTALEEVDFSFNRVTQLDHTLSRLPKVQSFTMTHNQLKDIGRYLVDLHSLTHLDLSNNQIEALDKWNEKLGNVKVLILAGNLISDLSGLSKLYSIEYLDVSNNQLSRPEDIAPIGGLPCLSELIVEGNELAERVDYRTVVLEAFGSRHDEVILDGKGVDGREKSTIGVRLALKRAQKEKERREEELRKRQERSSFLEAPADQPTTRGQGARSIGVSRSEGWTAYEGGRPRWTNGDPRELGAPCIPVDGMDYGRCVVDQREFYRLVPGGCDSRRGHSPSDRSQLGNYGKTLEAHVAQQEIGAGQAIHPKTTTVRTSGKEEVGMVALSTPTVRTSENEEDGKVALSVVSTVRTSESEADGKVAMPEARTVRTSMSEEVGKVTWPNAPTVRTSMSEGDGKVAMPEARTVRTSMSEEDGRVTWPNALTVRTSENEGDGKVMMRYANTVHAPREESGKVDTQAPTTVPPLTASMGIVDWRSRASATVPPLARAMGNVDWMSQGQSQQCQCQCQCQSAATVPLRQPYVAGSMGNVCFSNTVPISIPYSVDARGRGEGYGSVYPSMLDGPNQTGVTYHGNQQGMNGTRIDRVDQWSTVSSNEPSMCCDQIWQDVDDDMQMRDQRSMPHEIKDHPKRVTFSSSVCVTGYDRDEYPVEEAYRTELFRPYLDKESEFRWKNAETRPFKPFTMIQSAMVDAGQLELRDWNAYLEKWGEVNQTKSFNSFLLDFNYNAFAFELSEKEKTIWFPHYLKSKARMIYTTCEIENDELPFDELVEIFETEWSKYSDCIFYVMKEEEDWKEMIRIDPINMIGRSYIMTVHAMKYLSTAERKLTLLKLQERRRWFEQICDSTNFDSQSVTRLRAMVNSMNGIEELWRGKNILINAVSPHVTTNEKNGENKEYSFDSSEIDSSPLNNGVNEYNVNEWVEHDLIDFNEDSVLIPESDLDVIRKECEDKPECSHLEQSESSYDFLEETITSASQMDIEYSEKVIPTMRSLEINDIRMGMVENEQDVFPTVEDGSIGEYRKIGVGDSYELSKAMLPDGVKEVNSSNENEVIPTFRSPESDIMSEDSDSSMSKLFSRITECANDQAIDKLDQQVNENGVLCEQILSERIVEPKFRSPEIKMHRYQYSKSCHTDSNDMKQWKRMDNVHSTRYRILRECKIDIKTHGRHYSILSGGMHSVY